MNSIKKLEDLISWKEAVKLLKMSYRILSKLPEEERYNLKKHIMACSRNIPANIAEGFGRYYSRDSIQFYRIAIGSLNELKSDMYATQELGYIKPELTKTICEKIDSCLNLVYGLVRSANIHKVRSQKYA